jgi:hypothetical protein
MKKTPKKLKLAKETVRSLDELANAQGGYSLTCPSVGLCPNKPDPSYNGC